ncbi:MAG: suppressor of fused domain protein [Myxococcales bacterium]|nr:suppressor of fused domain protein [Myxococcales bacterium]TDJ05552.1 MAG: suppressor of fused domain protein [Deltaproteobacteria bacterium]
MPTIAEAVLAHARRNFPERAVDKLRWEQGGLVENIPDLALIRVAGSEDGAPWVYVSAGASAEAMDDGYGLEFFVVARTDQQEAAKLVAMVANLHADPRYPMSLGQVLEIGHPWLPGSSCDHLLVCLPGPFGEEFEWHSPTEHTIRFIWLMPITRSEAEFVRQHGFAELQRKLGTSQADVTALERSSVV